MAEGDVQHVRRSELCQPIQKLYQSTMYRSMCSPVLDHLHDIWAVLAAAGMLLVMVLTFAAFVDLERGDVVIDDDTPTARARRRRQLKAAARRRKKRALAAIAMDPSDGQVVQELLLAPGGSTAQRGHRANKTRRASHRFALSAT